MQLDDNWLKICKANLWEFQEMYFTNKFGPLFSASETVCVILLWFIFFKNWASSPTLRREPPDPWNLARSPTDTQTTHSIKF